MLKRLWRKIAPNPLDQLLKKAKKNKQKRFLLVWNRGLGDIALGLYAIVQRIRECVPECTITFLTRSNLKEGFILLGDVEILIDPKMKRCAAIDVEKSLLELGMDHSFFDVIIPYPDPTYWVKWQLGKIVPKLIWQNEWDDLWEKHGLKKEERYVGMHLQTETNYATWRNWPMESWQELITVITQKYHTKVLLFGFEKNPPIANENVIDLRGETHLFELLSIIKNCCQALVVPDSGVSSMTYFLNTPFPLTLVSLWGNPHNGILKQNVASPNRELKHIPLIGENREIANIKVEQVEEALFGKKKALWKKMKE